MKEILYATADTSLKDDLNQLESRVSDLETALIGDTSFIS